MVDFLDFLRFRASQEIPSSRVREAMRLYTAGDIGLGRAAEMAGMNYFLFEELLRKQDMPVVEPHVMNEAGRAVQRETADEVLA
jgi:predicted HTH domain antitoxin